MLSRTTVVKPKLIVVPPLLIIIYIDRVAGIKMADPPPMPWASTPYSNCSKITPAPPESGGDANKKSKSIISVGIIGYPNVGKSSILNSLKRFRAVSVSPRPGHTTSLTEVVLDKNIRLIDSPGVVFDDSDGNEGASAVL